MNENEFKRLEKAQWVKKKKTKKNLLFDKPDDPEKPTVERKSQPLRAIHIILHESRVPSFENMCMHMCAHTHRHKHAKVIKEIKK